MEYPKSLYRRSVEDHVIVKDDSSEKEKRKEGYEMYHEIHCRMISLEAEIKGVPKRGRPKAA